MDLTFARVGIARDPDYPEANDRWICLHCASTWQATQDEVRAWWRCPNWCNRRSRTDNVRVPKDHARIRLLTLWLPMHAAERLDHMAAEAKLPRSFVAWRLISRSPIRTTDIEVIRLRQRERDAGEILKLYGRIHEWDGEQRRLRACACQACRLARVWAGQGEQAPAAPGRLEP